MTTQELQRFKGHRLLGIECDHQLRNDTVVCECGWTDRFSSIGAAFDGWLDHAYAALKVPPTDETELREILNHHWFALEDSGRQCGTQSGFDWLLKTLLEWKKSKVRPVNHEWIRKLVAACTSGNSHGNDVSDEVLCHRVAFQINKHFGLETREHNTDGDPERDKGFKDPYGGMA